MEKSIKINIAGIIFQISDDAYEMLRDYLQSVTNKLSGIPGGSEIIDDIEARIAELFQSRPSWQTAVISKEEVEEMISTMGTAEEIAGELESETEGGYQREPQRRLYRNTGNSVFGGVCSGIADYTGIDAVWIRILFVLFTLAYFVGALVYIILWIALPSSTGLSRTGQNKAAAGQASQTAAPAGEPAAGVGNAFNEIFSAFGKFFIILFRVILAIIGVAFIISGFSALFSFLFFTIFSSSVFMPGFMESSILYLPEFLLFITEPPMAVWMTILVSLVVGLPLLALIYWGIRMVFQFRVRDLALNLSMLLIWILSCTALAIILFTEGIGFSSSGRTTEHIRLPASDTLYVSLDNRVTELDYDKKVKIPFEKFSLYFEEEEKVIYGTPEINIYHTDEEAHIKVVRYSNGGTHSDAKAKAESLIYNINIEDNIIVADEYFTVPPGNKWSGGFVKIRLYIPDNLTIFFDEDLEDIMRDNYFGCGIQSWEAGGRYWKMKDGQLKDTD
ncbi:MAG: PspC domain-containing protein [Bacteroidota bacterium]